jgi:hypothetical protein
MEEFEMIDYRIQLHQDPIFRQHVIDVLDSQDFNFTVLLANGNFDIRHALVTSDVNSRWYFGSAKTDQSVFNIEACFHLTKAHFPIERTAAYLALTRLEDQRLEVSPFSISLGFRDFFTGTAALNIGMLTALLTHVAYSFLNVNEDDEGYDPAITATRFKRFKRVGTLLIIVAALCLIVGLIMFMWSLIDITTLRNSSLWVTHLWNKSVAGYYTVLFVVVIGAIFAVVYASWPLDTHVSMD